MILKKYYSNRDGLFNLKYELQLNPPDNSKYLKYRIPGIASTKKDTLLVWLEARTDTSDWADIDILLFRSEDAGESFSEPVLLAGGTTNTQTLNNPVIIVGNDSTLHFLYCVEYGVTQLDGGVFYRKSTDDGISWSEPVDISASTLPEYRNAFAIGPGHGICLSDGTLLVPVWLVPKSKGSELRSHHPAEVRVLYSKDSGDTWSISKAIPQGDIFDPNETSAVELEDGGVMLNIRTDKGVFRCLSHSKDGIRNYTTMSSNSQLPDPSCFGSMIKYRIGKKCSCILFSNCADSYNRRNLTLSISRDSGESWQRLFCVDPDPTAYSDLCCDNYGNLYVLYETL